MDKLLDITTCSHTILLCDEPGSECKDGKDCKFKAHIKCDSPCESKVQWLAAQRAKMTNDDKVGQKSRERQQRRKLMRWRLR